MAKTLSDILHEVVDKDTQEDEDFNLPSTSDLNTLLNENDRYVKTKLLKLTKKALQNLEYALDMAETPTELVTTAEKVLNYLGIFPDKKLSEARNEGARIASASIATALQSLANIFGVKTLQEHTNGEN